MSAASFSQPSVAHALCVALATLHDAPEMSADTLAEAVAPRFPDVPRAALCVVAEQVLRLHFEPVTVANIESAGLDINDELIASEFFRAVHQAHADARRAERAREGDLRALRERMALWQLPHIAIAIVGDEGSKP